MGKKRIFEVAKELGVKSTEITELLAKNNITKTNFSGVDDADMKIIRTAFKKAPEAEKAPAQAGNGKAQAQGSEKSKTGRPAKQERPSMIVKPVIMTVETRDGKTTITRPIPAPSTPEANPAPSAPAAEAAKKTPPSRNFADDRNRYANMKNNDGKNKYRNFAGNSAKAAATASASPVAPPPTEGDKPILTAPAAPSAAEANPAVSAPVTAAVKKAPPARNFADDRNRYANYNKQVPGTSAARPAAGTPVQNRPGEGQSRPGGFNNNRPQGQGRDFGNRPGGFNNNRPQGQGRDFGNRPGGFNNNRPQGQSRDFGNRPGGFNNNRPQGQGRDFGNRPGDGQNRGSFNGNRPGGFAANRSGGSFGGFNKDKDGDQNNRFGNNRPGGNRPGAARKPAAPALDDLPRGKESREKYNKKHDKQAKGTYATRDSRPMRSADHMRPNRPVKGKGSAPLHQDGGRTQIIRPSMVQIGESINVQEFAKLIKREVAEVIKCLFLLGEMVTINQDIDFDTATLVGTELGVEIQPLPPEEDPTEIPEVEDDPKQQVARPPVVTVMGHVDHGKTSLLDAIRKTHVTDREAGGITQHIGAYTVNAGGRKITFLDTPGHEAFTAMRARGAQCTDISVLVVAADDGVMPQTVEAINHSKAAGVPIIVAINKMDKPAANPDHVKQQLSEMELIPEDWGGDTIMVPVSAHSHQGIDDLLEMILLVAEMKELKANPKLPAHGTIVEAKLDKGRGPVATVLVQRGTLTIGDYVIAGTAHGRVRALINDRGEKVRKAGPSTPVEMLGLNEVPQAGDIMDVAEEKIARGVADKRIAKNKAEQQKSAKVSLDDIFSRIKEGELKELNIVVKADVQGSVEALCASLIKIQNEEVKVTVVHSGVGAINESDVMLASAANALIIGFNVRPDANARKVAENEQVDIRPYRVIYDAINDVEAAIKGMLAPKFVETVIGRVEVRQVITISKLIIAGCYVTEGKVTNNAKIRVVRDGIVIAEDEMDSLRRFKDDVKEVAAGYECGIILEKFHDIKEGDQFEAYMMKEITPE